MKRKKCKKNTIIEIKSVKRKPNKRTLLKKEKVSSYNLRERKEKEENEEMEVIDLNSPIIKEEKLSPKMKKSKKSVNKRSKKNLFIKEVENVFINLDEEESEEKKEVGHKAPQNTIKIKKNKLDNVLTIYEIIDSSSNHENLLKSNASLSEGNIKMPELSNDRNKIAKNKPRKGKQKEKNATVSNVPKMLNRKREKDVRKIKEEILNSNLKKNNPSKKSKSKNNRKKSFSFNNDKSSQQE